ncbi:hypothetical protein HOP50_01g03630 [Chloropicon primus]|uniref:CBM20 domain-containing protein n=2 Tax=Chloropicon primus TaxID=1764295 RepID=A0A5B8MBL7_9CHLO|nr:hypothetical protein A3770_01p03740 [Chloropicon primus]UPQ97072.1 hypothetical protein HOP50_01g03630 [Chloropicon primus]|eukprot:QDZ17856.1 hypothetical protein A3770_01p03740 [Chloropicon primus]
MKVCGALRGMPVREQTHAAGTTVRGGGCASTSRMMMSSSPSEWAHAEGARRRRARGWRGANNLAARCSKEDSIVDSAGVSKYVSGRDQRKSSASGANASNQAKQVRVRFRLQYRCHSRQMLAVAGSMAPLGWSFLSIARNPLNWTEGDWWTIELNFPEGARIEYKYVVLEDQNWTKQDDEAAEGLVPLYRPSGDVTEPVTEAIVRKMAIVAWQPGPNLVYTVPSQGEAAGESPGATGETFVDEDKVTVIPITEKLDFYDTT